MRKSLILEFKDAGIDIELSQIRLHRPLRIKDQWFTVLVKCQFVCNRVLSVLTSMPFDGTSLKMERTVGKGLRSNGTSNIAGFFQRNRFTRLGKDWKDRANASVSLLTFYSIKQTFTRSSRPLLVGFLSRYSDILSSSLRSGMLWDRLRFICFWLSGLFCKYD